MSKQRLWEKAKAWRALGPYLLIELFLPGGTLLALLLWLAQRMMSVGSHRDHRLEGQPKQIATAAEQPSCAPQVAGELSFNGGCPVVR